MPPSEKAAVTPSTSDATTTNTSITSSVTTPSSQSASHVRSLHSSQSCLIESWIGGRVGETQSST
jgi:hypothetical protein